MKSFLSFFFLLVLLGKLLLQVGLLSYFYQNREWIVSNLCVQRNLETNTCQGMCHLKKSIGETENKNEALAGVVESSFELIESLDNMIMDLISPVWEFKSLFSIFYFFSIQLFDLILEVPPPNLS